MENINESSFYKQMNTSNKNNFKINKQVIKAMNKEQKLNLMQNMIIVAANENKEKNNNTYDLPEVTVFFE